MRIWRDVGEAMMAAFREQEAVDFLWWHCTVPHNGWDDIERITR